jgi:hypothetical protein
VAGKAFTVRSFLLRLIFAALLVGGTYNPEGVSYYHWVEARLPDFGAEEAVVGVVLLIGWVVFLRATARSLGRVGVILAVALFASVVWLLVSRGWFSPDSPRALAYTELGIVALILAVGMSWSHIRRQMSGQVDVVEEAE